MENKTILRCLEDNLPCSWKGDCNCPTCRKERRNTEYKIMELQKKRLLEQIKNRTYSE